MSVDGNGASILDSLSKLKSTCLSIQPFVVVVFSGSEYVHERSHPLRLTLNLKVSKRLARDFLLRGSYLGYFVEEGVFVRIWN